MSRRENNAHLAFQLLQDSQLQNQASTVVLKRCLSTRSVVSTPSSFAQRLQRASSIRPELQVIQEIGVGLQGAVFEQVGRELVMKKEKPGNEKLRSNLRNEYQLHEQVEAAFREYHGAAAAVFVPQLSCYIGVDDADADNGDFWTERYLSRFPEPHRQRGDIVEMERILPLPKVVRRALISHFYSSGDHDESREQQRSGLIDQILNKPENKHCLVRPYLGKQDHHHSRNINDFSLRNFLLPLKAITELELDAVQLSSAYGAAYATMNWGACINADDVEFVLGSSATSPQGSSSNPPALPSLQQKRTIKLFLLDFGQCDAVDLTLEPHVVYHAFKGAMMTGDNQWFIPNCIRNRDLFAHFRRAYIETGTEVLARKELADRFDLEEFMDEYEEYAEDFLL